MSKSLSWLCLIATTGSLIFSVSSQEIMRFSFVYLSYYILTGLLAFLTFLLYKFFREHQIKLIFFIKENKKYLTFVFLLTLVISITVPSYFRVLSDETNLTSISKALTFEKMADNPTDGVYHFQTLRHIRRVYSKRPLMQPYLTHLVHVITGYRVNNIFFLNNFLLFLCLAIIFFTLHRAIGPPWAVSGTLLVAGHPILTQSANSGGMGMLFVTLLVSVLALLRWYLKSPTKERFVILWIHLMIFLHSRYEALFITSIIMVFLFIYKKPRPIFFLKNRYFLSLTLIFSAPVIWQRLTNIIDNDAPGRIIYKAFGFDYLLKNNMIFFKNLIQPEMFLPFNSVASIVGIIGLVVFLITHVKARRKLPDYRHQWVVISSAIFIFLWFFITSYFLGDISHPAASRLFAPFFVFLSLGFLYLCFKYIPSKNRAIATIIISSLIFISHHPKAMNNRFALKQTRVREYQHIMHFLKSVPNKRFLVFYTRPGMLTIHNIGAVTFKHANQYPAGHLSDLKKNLYEAIYVIQEIRYDSGQAEKSSSLSEQYVLETLTEIQNKKESFIRISKVVID